MGKVTAAILGLGESVSLYRDEFDITIGVNDIWRYVCTDYLVCVDKRDVFTPDRLQVIDNSRPARFYSQLDCWSDRPDFHRIDLEIGYPEYVCQLKLKTIPKSIISPFVAAAIAYKFHEAKEIHLFGVDLQTHWKFNPEHADRVAKIYTHFRNFRDALAKDGGSLHVHGNGALKGLEIFCR